PPHTPSKHQLFAYLLPMAENMLTFRLPPFLLSLSLVYLTIIERKPSYRSTIFSYSSPLNKQRLLFTSNDHAYYFLELSPRFAIFKTSTTRAPSSSSTMIRKSPSRFRNVSV